MGRKPSMFSRNYRNQLRKRRIRYATAISVIIIIFLVVIFSSSFKGITSNIKTSIISVFSKENKKTVEDPNKSNEQGKENEVAPSTEAETKPILAEEQFVLNLKSNESVNIVYKVNGDKKEIKAVTGNGKISYNISPSKDKVVISDSKTQDLYIADLNKNISNITKEEYVSTKKEIFKKETVLTRFPSYIWLENPTFIDDTHIAYVSNLPWINNSGTKYLWIIDTTTTQHKSYSKIKGSNIQFGDITSKGLTLNIDNKTMYVDIHGNITM